MADRTGGHPLPESGDEAATSGPGTSMWYVAVAGQVYGPADVATLRRWVAQGKMPPGTQVRAADGDSWSPVTAFPELRDLAFLAPPRPTYQPAATHSSTEAALSAVAPCPHCRGPVLNIAPPYGWPWGLWQRALKPQFVCGSCGTPIRSHELAPAAQAEVARKARVAIVWLIVTALFILIVLSPFLVALVHD